jgi:hypothetical protein
MQRIRIQRTVRRPKTDRYEIPPLDPRDPDVARAKELARKHT